MNPEIGIMILKKGLKKAMKTSTIVSELSTFFTSESHDVPAGCPSRLLMYLVKIQLKVI